MTGQTTEKAVVYCHSVYWLKLFVLLFAATLALFLVGCKRINERDFVGKWQSSRTLTPLHLAANGEWEIRTTDGAVLQYGIWRYEDKKIVWTIRQDGQIINDVNPVLFVGPSEFRVKEQNGTTTVFKRLE